MTLAEARKLKPGQWVQTADGGGRVRHVVYVEPGFDRHGERVVILYGDRGCVEHGSAQKRRRGRGEVGCSQET